MCSTLEDPTKIVMLEKPGSLFFFYRLCDARRHRGGEPPAPCPMSLARRGTAFIGSWTKANPIIQPSSPHPMRLNLPGKWSGGIGRGKVDMWKSIFPYLTLRFPHVPCISLLSRKKTLCPLQVLVHEQTLYIFLPSLP